MLTCYFKYNLQIIIIHHRIHLILTENAFQLLQLQVTEYGNQIHQIPSQTHKKIFFFVMIRLQCNIPYIHQRRPELVMSNENIIIHQRYLYSKDLSSSTFKQNFGFNEQLKLMYWIDLIAIIIHNIGWLLIIIGSY